MSTASAPLFSPYWYKLGELKPRLRPSVTLSRREEGGEIWHVLAAPESNKQFRLDEASYAIVGALDGRTSLNAIWEKVLERFGDDAPGQDETIRLLGQLHQADALNSGTRPTMAEYARRARKQRRQATQGYFKNPLFLRIPLFDPHDLIEVTYPYVRPIFSWVGFAFWLAVMVWLGTQVGQHWERLSNTIADQALAADNLLIAALVFPVAKALHELAHGWAVRHWGGSVREFGIMFLVFLPAPFVDASASSAFVSKRARVIVAAAGMMAEALLAALAMLIWTGAETGIVSAIAFNTLLVAGVSTFLFNGNPLLRFDAYFILSDLIEVQNLAPRSQKWWGWLVHRFGFGIDTWENPARSLREAVWFAFYHPASYAYRVFLTLTIALFVASSYPVIGLALAAWSITTTFILPLVKALWEVSTGPRIKEHRGRAVFVTGVLLGLPLALLFFVPVPHGTVAAGIVQRPQDAPLIAAAEAVFTDIQVPAGEAVSQGADVAHLDAPLLRVELAVLEAQLEASLSRLAAHEASEDGAARAAAERAESGYLREEIATVRDDLGALDLGARASGIVVARSDGMLPGRRVAKGTELGVILRADDPVELQVAVPADRIDLVRLSPAAVQIRHPGQGFAPFAGETLRIAPKSTRVLFAPALAASSGGPFTLDPSDREGLRAVQAFHAADVITTMTLSQTAVGARVWVRFDHGASPLAPRLWRAVRQIFLSRLAV